MTLRPPHGRQTVRRAGDMILPIRLTLLGVALGAAIFVAGTAVTAGANVVRTAFVLRSALTVPRMRLEQRARLASAGTSVHRSNI